MSLTQLADVQEQVQKFWSPLFVPELKEMALLPSLVDRSYDGQIKQGGDTVYISQFIGGQATRKNTSDADADTFETSKIQTRRVGIVADQVIVAARDVSSLADLQSQIGSPDGKSELRRILLKDMELALNDYLYSLVAPAVASSGVTDFNATAALVKRKYAAQQQWPNDGRWFMLLDPSFMNDFLSAQTLTSSDFVGDERPVIAGQFVNRRFGFNILEDTSAAMRQISPTNASEDLALAFHQDFMHLVMQSQPEFKVSDLHPLGKLGYKISVSMVCGAKIGLQGDVKHSTAYNV